VKNKIDTFLRDFALVLDISLINLVFLFLFQFLKHGLHLKFYPHYFFLLAVFNAFWLLSTRIFHVYEGDKIYRFEDFGANTIKAYVTLVTLMLLYIFLYKQDSFSRTFVVYTFIAIVIVLLINRAFFLFINYYLKTKTSLKKRVAILGYSRNAQGLARHFINNTGYEFIGFFTDRDNCPVELRIGDLENILPVSMNQEIGAIYSTLSPEQYPYIYDLANECEDKFIRFLFVPDFNMFVNRKTHIDFFGDIPVLSLRREPLESFGNRAMKRIFDIFFSILIIVLVLSWLLPIIAIFIKLETKGPIFFVQKRSGRNNKEFLCIKFRTMCVNNDSHLKQATKDDNRITRVGRFLRRTNLDEMPQFFNVLFSQMSVVGPRPHMLKHTADYSKLISKFMVRQFLKPGITGWAQVNGYRGQTETLDQMEKRVEYDIWYMENWSILLDLRIILKTAFMFFKLDKNAF